MPGRIEKLFAALLHHKGLKLLAIVLATVTWIYIRETTSFEDTVEDVPVEITLPEGWAVQDRSVNSVNVGVSGSQADVRALRKEEITIKTDARGRNIEPDMLIKLDLSDVATPRSVRPLYIDPSEIVLTLDRETQKVVKIEVDLLGQPPEGYDVESISVTPSTVVVSGPERRLANVESVRTVPIDLEGRIRSFQIKRELVKPGENWQARMAETEVRVEFAIVERLVRRDFTNVLVKALLPPGASVPVSFFPPSVNVSLKGRTDVISNLTLVSVNAFADCTDLAPGSAEDLTVQIPTRSGLNIIAVDPPVVRAEMMEPPP